MFVFERERNFKQTIVGIGVVVGVCVCLHVCMWREPSSCDWVNTRGGGVFSFTVLHLCYGSSLPSPFIVLSSERAAATDAVCARVGREEGLPLLP